MSILCLLCAAKYNSYEFPNILAQCEFHTCPYSHLWQRRLLACK